MRQKQWLEEIERQPGGWYSKGVENFRKIGAVNRYLFT